MLRLSILIAIAAVTVSCSDPTGCTVPGNLSQPETDKRLPTIISKVSPPTIKDDRVVECENDDLYFTNETGHIDYAFSMVCNKDRKWVVKTHNGEKILDTTDVCCLGLIGPSEKCYSLGNITKEEFDVEYPNTINEISRPTIDDNIVKCNNNTGELYSKNKNGSIGATEMKCHNNKWVVKVGTIEEKVDTTKACCVKKSDCTRPGDISKEKMSAAYGGSDVEVLRPTITIDKIFCSGGMQLHYVNANDNVKVASPMVCEGHKWVIRGQGNFGDLFKQKVDKTRVGCLKITG